MRQAIRTGGLIGLVSGLLTGPIMLLWLVIYSLLRPNDDLGSTAALGPFSGGITSTILGCVPGVVAAAFVGLAGRQLSGLRRSVLFGAILMAVVGTLQALLDHLGSPERLAAWLTLIAGMDVAAPIVAGIVGGAIVGRLSKRSSG